MSEDESWEFVDIREALSDTEVEPGMVNNSSIEPSKKQDLSEWTETTEARRESDQILVASLKSPQVDQTCSNPRIGLKRLRKELITLNKDTLTGVAATPFDDDLVSITYICKGYN
jgi:hypothetical protein